MKRECPAFLANGLLHVRPTSKRIMRRHRSRFAVFLDAAAALARTFAVRQERQDCRRPEVLLSIRFMGKPAQSCCFMSSKSDFSVLESRQRPENSKAATRVASTGFVFFVFLEDAPRHMAEMACGLHRLAVRSPARAASSRHITYCKGVTMQYSRSSRRRCRLHLRGSVVANMRTHANTNSLVLA